jgi:putative transposase
MDRGYFSHGKQIRLKGYDYSKPGAYFVTLCCKDRQCYFGRIENRKIIFSTMGKIAKRNWENIPRHFKNVILDDYIIMPNHLHGIIHIIHDNNCRGLINQILTIVNQTHNTDITHWILMKDPNITLGKIIRYFKAKSTRFIRQNGYKIFAWQRNYYEHVIQNIKSLQTIRRYIINNPLKWDLDKDNPNIDRFIK